VSGATWSSKGILEATKIALAQAVQEEPDQEAAEDPEQPETVPEETPGPSKTFPEELEESLFGREEPKESYLGEEEAK
jgi:hypothetical protein